MQNVFIINFHSLYEILDEIKENLFFKIIKLENENNIKNNSDLDKINSLIISKTNHKLLLNRDITDKNLLNFNDLPMTINKLLELINLKLMKLKFNYQTKVNINGYELNLNSKFLSKNDLNLKLTEKETEIILYLYETKKNHDVADLKISGVILRIWKLIRLKLIFTDSEKKYLKILMIEILLLVKKMDIKLYKQFYY